MKLKEAFFLLGLRPRPRVYGSAIREFGLRVDGPVRYAQWLHPNESLKRIAQEDVDELRTFLRPGDVAVDIGAHTGDSTLPIALAVGKSGCVLALEPNRYVFPVLERNAALNPAVTNILPLMIAATPKDGEFQFEYSDAGFCNGGSHQGISPWRHGSAFKLMVQGRNLEALLRTGYPELIGRLRYVKVDAEGFDHAVLASLAALLDQRRPYLKAEIFKRTTRQEREAFLAFLRRHGYRVHHVESEHRYRGELVTVAKVMRWPHYDVFCVPDGGGDM